MDLSKLTIDRGAGPRRARRRRSPLLRWVILLLLLGAGWVYRAPLLALVDGVRSTDVQLATATLVDPAARAAEVAAASGAAANGYVVARRRAALSADTPGRIIELNVEEGSVVKKGDVVARLYADEAEAALRRAQSERDAADSAVRAAEGRIDAAGQRLEEARAFIASVTSQRDEVAAALELAEREYTRSAELVERGAVPRERFEQAESGLAQARARLAGAEATLARARASVGTAESDVALAVLEREQSEAQLPALDAACDLARATLDKTIVRAPFDGIVVLKDAEVGEVVSPNALGGQSRGSVATMVDFSTLEIQVELPETSLGAVEVGRPAEVYLDAFADERFAGTVLRIWPTANRQKATIEVRVGLERIDPRLRPEMGARVVFTPAAAASEAPARGGAAQEGPAEPVLVVPSAAVIEREGTRGVFVVEAGRARFRPVVTGAPTGRRVAVTDGLAAGDVVVAAPAAGLTDGARVRAQN